MQRQLLWDLSQALDSLLHRRRCVRESARQFSAGSLVPGLPATACRSKILCRFFQTKSCKCASSQGTSCNVYNQGCAGGYAFLALKFGHEHGFRTQQCVDEYQKSTKEVNFQRPWCVLTQVSRRVLIFLCCEGEPTQPGTPATFIRIQR